MVRTIIAAFSRVLALAFAPCRPPCSCRHEWPFQPDLLPYARPYCAGALKGHCFLVLPGPKIGRAAARSRLPVVPIFPDRNFLEISPSLPRLHNPHETPCTDNALYKTRRGATATIFGGSRPLARALPRSRKFQTLLCPLMNRRACSCSRMSPRKDPLRGKNYYLSQFLHSLFASCWFGGTFFLDSPPGQATGPRFWAIR
jgi:hypothetical protein